MGIGRGGRRGADRKAAAWEEVRDGDSGATQRHSPLPAFLRSSKLDVCTTILDADWTDGEIGVVFIDGLIPSLQPPRLAPVPPEESIWGAATTPVVQGHEEARTEATAI